MLLEASDSSSDEAIIAIEYLLKKSVETDSETDTTDYIEAHDRVSPEIWIVEKGVSNYQYI